MVIRSHSRGAYLSPADLDLPCQCRVLAHTADKLRGALPSHTTSQSRKRSENKRGQTSRRDAERKGATLEVQLTNYQCTLRLGL